MLQNMLIRRHNLVESNGVLERKYKFVIAGKKQCVSMQNNANVIRRFAQNSEIKKVDHRLIVDVRYSQREMAYF